MPVLNAFQFVQKTSTPFLMLALLAVFSSVIFYLPFIVGNEMHIVFRYWDGPNYSYLAKALYNIPRDHPLSPYTKPEYFAAYLPLYPLTIRLFSFLGYNNAMIFLPCCTQLPAL